MDSKTLNNDKCIIGLHLSWKYYSNCDFSLFLKCFNKNKKSYYAETIL